jgi:hypothetical protein
VRGRPSKELEKLSPLHLAGDRHVLSVHEMVFGIVHHDHTGSVAEIGEQLISKPWNKVRAIEDLVVITLVRLCVGRYEVPQRIGDESSLICWIN